MNYNRAIHHRRSIRLKGYDYSQAGAYFITICTHNRQQFFGIIVRAGLAPAQMVLNEYGRIAHEQWLQIPTRFANIELDAFVVMPNHIHGIIVIHTPAPHVNSGQPNSGQPQGLPLRKTIGDIVGVYKSIVANECLKIFKSNNETMGKIWQRNYWEHIIRDEKSFQKIAIYIENNPAKWQEDKFFVGI
jgi:REP element-mobilizing transposase RayT